METTTVCEEMNEIRLAIKNCEYEFAKLKLNELLERDELNYEELKKVKAFSVSIHKYFHKINDETLEDIFLKAFLGNYFLVEFFLEWFNRFIKTKIFTFSKLQLKALSDFFINENISNLNKCFVLDAIAFLKINLNVIFLNNQLKTVDQINTITLNELAIVKQKKEIVNFLNKKNNFNLTIDENLQRRYIYLVNYLCAYCFPMQINFPTSDVSIGIYEYANKGLEFVNELKNQNFDKKLIEFLLAIFEHR